MTAPIIQIRRAADRFRTPTAWGQSLHTFSFGSHYDPDNVSHGALMANNEELVGSGAGFDPHPHADAEIITWVLSGSLLHTDSFDHAGIVYPGLAQRMSAGSGIVHSERNDAYRVDASQPRVPVHFVQMWVRPDEPGLPPSYQQRELDLSDLDGGWVPVASGSRPDAAVRLNSAGSTLWAARLEPGVSRLLPLARLSHLYLTRGQLTCESVGLLTAGDSLRITGEAELRLTGGGEPAEVLVWELRP
ncbi:MAG TPA: pirin family protein [Dermatophilaceae bacterium]|nr:pirin family protein [Dermatophilaceae bacterium]